MGWNHQPVLKKESTLKTDAWWSLTWRFYSALAGTPKNYSESEEIGSSQHAGWFQEIGGLLDSQIDQVTR